MDEEHKKNLAYAHAQVSVVSGILDNNPSSETCKFCAEVLAEWAMPLLEVRETKESGDAPDIGI